MVTVLYSTPAQSAALRALYARRYVFFPADGGEVGFWLRDAAALEGLAMLEAGSWVRTLCGSEAEVSGCGNWCLGTRVDLV